VQVEVTASLHVGVHRYTFNSHDKQSSNILFDIAHTVHPNACKYSMINVTGNNEISGYVLNAGSLTGRGYFERFGGGVHIYFVAQFDQPFTSFGTWNNETTTFNTARSGVGIHNGAFVGFGHAKQVTAYVGISFINVEQARINLYGEAKTAPTAAFKGFDQMKKEAEDEWAQYINTVQVRGGTEQEKVKFFSAIYHAFMSPTTWSEYGNVYVGFDGKVHSISPGTKAHYTDMSIWDVHRTQFPLIGLWDPPRMQDIVQSLMNMYIQGGELPKWPCANGYTGCMIGTHADVVLSDALLKGILNPSVVNYTVLLNSVLSAANNNSARWAGRWNPAVYQKFGFVPYPTDKHSVCWCLCYLLLVGS